MITFRPMPPLALLRCATDARFFVRVIRRWPPILALLAASVASPATAQAPLSPTEDAVPVPGGTLRLHVSTSWIRYDERFAPDGRLASLGADLSTDTLGVAQLPRLAPIEAGLRTLASDPQLRLSLGRLDVRSDARIAVTPISLEYGVTRRFSIGIEVPIVETRRVVQLRVNEDSSALANVGFVPQALRDGAVQQNRAVAEAFRSGADSLGVLLAQCPANPGAAGCASVNANPAEAAAARQLALSFANAVGSLGLDAASLLVAPRGGSTLGNAIDARRLAINQQLQQFLGAGAGATTSIFNAPTPFSYLDLQGQSGSPGLLQSPLGGALDSLRTTDRIGIGDVSVGAQFLIFDRFSHDSLPLPRLQSRLVLGAAIRFGTSQADSARNLVDIATGEGPGVEVHAAMDLISGRIGGTIAVRYVKSFARTVTAPLLGDPEASFPFPLFGERPRTAGDVIGLDLTPRFLITEWLALDGHYGYERTGAAMYGAPDLSLVDPCVGCVTPAVVTTSGVTRTAQRVGLGFRYSTTDAYARGRARFPAEITFTHLETITGDSGLPNSTRDMIQLRLYYRLRR
jgi:hypothetical protein